MLQPYTAYSLHIFIHLKWRQTASSFPNFDGPNAFPPSSTGPWPRFLKGRKIHDHLLIFDCIKVYKSKFMLSEPYILYIGNAVAECFEPHRSHCVVSLLSTGSTQEDLS